MCSTTREGAAREVAGGPGRSVGDRSYSLVRRLVGWQVATSAALLALLGTILNLSLSRALSQRHVAFLRNKAALIERLFLEAPRSEALTNEVTHEAGEGAVRYFIRIRDAAGRVVIETPGSERALPPTWEEPVLPGGGDGDSSRPILREKPGWLYWVQVLRDSGGAPVGRIELAMDVAEDGRFLAGYRRLLVVTLLAGLVAAAGVAHWTARRSLRPLQVLVERTQEVDADHLGSRIQAATWPVELRRLADALNTMLERLQQSFERLGQVSAELAHELRTPLSNFRGEAEVALSRARSAEEYRAVLESGLEETDRLLRLIQDILFLARTEQTGLPQRQRLSLRQALGPVMEFYEPVAEDKGVSLLWEGEATLEGEPRLLQRAIGNLLANAIRHTPAGGMVKLACETLPDGTVEITVQDTGEGIPVEAQPHVFDRFYRVAGRRDPARGGTGLGLAIVQSIVRVHGGTIRLWSEPGMGACFTLQFPPSRQTRPGG